MTEKTLTKFHAELAQLGQPTSGCAAGVADRRARGGTVPAEQ
jgi:hypothetical protein